MTIGRFLKLYVVLNIIVLGILSIPLSIMNNEAKLLADNIYFEARNSTIEDQIAIGLVVYNRIKSNKYPNNMEDVIFQKGQFSWTVEYSKPNRDSKAWGKAFALAKTILLDYEHFKRDDVCLHYSSSISGDSNHWTRNFDKVTKIGKHFYFCEEK